MRLDLATSVAEPSGDHLVSDDDLVELLTRGGRDLWPGPARRAENVLISTGSPKVRNAAALALVDVGYPGPQTVINKALAKPGVANASGTLLFCLLETRSCIDATAIPDIVRNGSYEARSELLMLTADGMVRFEDDAQMERPQTILGDIASCPDDQAADVGRLVIRDLEAVRQA